MSVLGVPIALVGFISLCEQDRLPWGALIRVATALRLGNMVWRVANLTLKMARTVNRVLRDGVSDRPERVIVAGALSFGESVSNRDSQSRTSAIPTIW
jgi:hypothetical protein